MMRPRRVTRTSLRRENRASTVVFLRVIIYAMLSIGIVEIKSMGNLDRIYSYAVRLVLNISSPVSRS